MYHAAELHCEIMCCRAPAETRCCMIRAFLQAFRRQARRQGGSIAGELHEMASMHGGAVVIAKIAKIARPSPGDSDSRNPERSFQTRPSSRVPTTLELFTTIATMPRAQWHSIAPRPGHSRQALQSQATSDSLQTKCLSNSTRRDATFHTTNTTPHGGNDAGPVFSDTRGRTRNIETTHQARHLPGRWAGETVGLEMDSSLPSPVPSRTCTYEGTSNGQRQLGRAGCLEIQLRPRHVADRFLGPLVAANEGD